MRSRNDVRSRKLDLHVISGGLCDSRGLPLSASCTHAHSHVIDFHFGLGLSRYVRGGHPLGPLPFQLSLAAGGSACSSPAPRPVLPRRSQGGIAAMEGSLSGFPAGSFGVGLRLPLENGVADRALLRRSFSSFFPSSRKTTGNRSGSKCPAISGSLSISPPRSLSIRPFSPETQKNPFASHPSDPSALTGQSVLILRGRGMIALS
jgi:hypothetical protein